MPRVSVVQAAPAAFDLEGTLDRFEQWLGEAARDAELVVFPEAFVGGYPKGADFGTRVGFRRPEGRELFRRYVEGALLLDGPAFSRLSQCVKARGTSVVVGVIEREGGTLYCSTLLFGAEGQLLGKHRKLVPTAMERLVWGAGDGSTLPVVDTPAGRVGTVICWENYMPLLRTAMYAKGVQLYCAPTVDDREVWQSTMRHIALEGRCFVLSSCQFATRADFPDDYPSSYGEDPTAVLIRGGSCVVDPLGEVVAGPLYGEAGILRAELDLGAIAAAQLDFDVVGHYARPDVFRLSVDERPKTSVEQEELCD